MAVNPLLSLQTQALDFGQAADRFTQTRQAQKQQEQQQEVIDLRKRGIELDEIKTAIEQQDAATQRRIRNNALDSLRLKQALESGGTEAAMDFLKNNKDRNDRLGFDSNETQEVMQLLESGDTDRLNTMLDNNILAGEAIGVIESTDSGRVRSLTPEEKKQAGFPEGAVVQQKPSGEFIVKFEPGDRGRARVEVSEDGSRAVFVDEVALAAGEEDAVSEIQLREPKQPERADIEPADSLFAMAEAATGPQATIRSVTARIPFTNVSESERESVTARRAFELTENELARGLVNNPRFPVREREAVINAINISPSVFDNPDAMKARLSAARDFLSSRLAQAERDAADETLPEKTREAQSSNASAMRNALDRIGKPAEETASTIRQIVDLDTESQRFVVDDMPEAQLRAMILDASDEDLGDLSEDTRARIAERLEGQ